MICGREKICPIFSAVTVKIGNFQFGSAPAALTSAAETITIVTGWSDSAMRIAHEKDGNE
jgi:hypothetical protein